MRTSIFLHSYWILRLPHILILPIWWVKIELSFCNFYFPSFQHAWNCFFSTYLLFIYTINISPYMNLFSYYFLDLFIFLQCIWSLVSRNINSFSIYMLFNTKIFPIISVLYFYMLCLISFAMEDFLFYKIFLLFHLRLQIFFLS